MYDLNIRRLLIGKPLKTNDAIHQRLSKAKALAVFSSDALSLIDKRTCVEKEGEQRVAKMLF